MCPSRFKFLTAIQMRTNEKANRWSYLDCWITEKYKKTTLHIARKNEFYNKVTNEIPTRLEYKTIHQIFNGEFPGSFSFYN